MGLLSSIGSLISKIFSAIFKFIKKIFGKFFIILLILVVIWFAPYLAGFFAGIGAPAFVVGVFETLALATPYLVSAVTWLWEGGASLVSSAWNAFKGMETGTQASILLGAAALIAPEETAAVVADVLDVVGDLVVAGTGALLSGITSNPLLLAAGLFSIYWFFIRDNDSSGNSERDPIEGDFSRIETPNPSLKGSP